MPFTTIFIHLVSSTKNRYPYLENKELREHLFNHILENTVAKQIFIQAINGHVDHVHILIRLKPDQQLFKVVQLIKGEGSRWLNKNNLTMPPFEWQDEYFATSVSTTNLQWILKYIENQENHHKEQSFEIEYSSFINHNESVKEI